MLTLYGCDASNPEVSPFELRDSSGVSIARNADVDLPEWFIDSIPSVDIGSIQGEQGQDLALPWASVRLPGGEIALSNARTNELRLYTASGSFIRAVGGEGDGPGEFQQIAALHLGRGDTIVAADSRRPRLNLFAPSGEFGRVITLEPFEGRNPRLQGILHDTVGVYRVTRFGSSGGRSGRARDTLVLAVRPFSGDSYGVIGRFVGTERFHQVQPNGGIAQWNLPFARDAHRAVSNTTIWVGISDTYEIRGYSREGRLNTVIRVDRSVRSVDGTQLDLWFDHALADLEEPNIRQMYREVRDVMEAPPTFPAFSSLATDTEGNVWVEEYQVPWAEDLPQWRIFDPSGRAKAVVRMPRGLLVQEIGLDYVMGLWLDALDVEHIRVYRLDRLQ